MVGVGLSVGDHADIAEGHDPRLGLTGCVRRRRPIVIARDAGGDAGKDAHQQRRRGQTVIHQAEQLVDLREPRTRRDGRRRGLAPGHGFGIGFCRGRCVLSFSPRQPCGPVTHLCCADGDKAAHGGPPIAQVHGPADFPDSSRNLILLG